MDDDTDRPTDRALGMDRKIDRRDFLNGVAIGAAAVVRRFQAGLRARRCRRTCLAYYPPTRTGMRGTIRAPSKLRTYLRDGEFLEITPKSPKRLTTVYDLVIVGGGHQRTVGRAFLPRRQTRRAHSDSWTITMISAAMPSATNFIWTAD